MNKQPKLSSIRLIVITIAMTGLFYFSKYNLVNKRSKYINQLNRCRISKKYFRLSIRGTK